MKVLQETKVMSTKRNNESLILTGANGSTTQIDSSGQATTGNGDRLDTIDGVNTISACRQSAQRG